MKGWLIMYFYSAYPPMPYQQPFYNAYPAFSLTSYRQYPPIDTTLFNQSIIAMQKLMKDASLILKKLAESKEFAFKVMSAAQESHTKEVKQLIESIGIQSKVDIYYNPDGIRLTLSSKAGQIECCKLAISLRWKTFL
ncbi:hypothetical protein HNQ85_001781 [Anoxybacillus calidus]|jgi:hypothetical protein|uniref:Inner spore coat protein n=1 Tax=[Anoxybacillus] calidus TaxID=575178 RepID=A0A7W0BWR3_9BACL|nr:hypothetical protein [Anoxybacillus calidus]MBA2871511.1 hypothetical protein [Anoxybacillus calidus]